jgi:two-component system, cell cycle sensor histidine kinase and response regulator CckA
MPSGGPGNIRDLPAEDLLRAVVDLSDDAILMLGANREIVTWSASAERIFGYGTEVVGTALDRLFPEHLRTGVWTILTRAHSGEEIRHFETEVVRSDGMPAPIWISVRPIVDSAGLFTGTAVIVMDVTEQRLAQATLAEMEARLEEGEALAHVGSWLWDLRTGAVQWSGEFHRIHGVDPIDFDGTVESHLDAIHPEDRERVRMEMEASVDSGRTFESEYRVVRSDGSVRMLHVRAQPTIGSTGAAVGLRGVGQDLTES